MALIELGNEGFSTVDEADIERLRCATWFMVTRGKHRYVMAWIGRRQVLMHRFLLGADGDFPVDHVNGDGLDNRRENLRRATWEGNSRNRRKSAGKSSRFKGVCFVRKSRKWKATIRRGNRWFHLGMFDKPKKAAAAYNRVARRLFGEFAKLNDLRPHA